MATTKTNLQDNLHKAFGSFLDAMRLYIVSLMQTNFGDDWATKYAEALKDDKKKHWELGLGQGSQPLALIDYSNLFPFAITYKNLLKDDFGKDAHNLPSKFSDLAKVRNDTYHHKKEATQNEIVLCYSQMIFIAEKLQMNDLVAQLTQLRDGKPEKAPAATPVSAQEGLVAWFRNVTPRLDIRQGNLDESVFAANLAEVALGHGRTVYHDRVTFFDKTYFTLGLKTVARRVIKGLNGEEDAENRVISLQTGFGGGKTHTLISLYHLAAWGKNVQQSAAAQNLLKFTGIPNFEKANIAVFTNTTNDPTQGRPTEFGLTIRTLWGELAFQLGGPQAYEMIRANDENRTAPKGLFKKVLAQTTPALILIDELADYCVAAAGVTVGGSTLADQTISFIQELSEAVAETNHCVLVATLPASEAEVANSPQASQILNSLQKRLSRVGADTKPVADEEIFEVIRRRLFEDLGHPDQIDRVIHAYGELYRKRRSELPAYASKTEYKERLKKSYPFHPELIDMFRIRWASNHDFQRTRGVLRLLASIVSDLWKRKGSLVGTNVSLIHSSDVDFGNLDALSGQLKKLFGNGYDAVMTADVSGSSSNAYKVDNAKPEYGDFRLAQGLAATVLLGSFGTTSANRGVSVAEAKLCLLRPDSFNHNKINGALDLLEGNAHYLYYSTVGSSSKRYWFHTKPNINILINQAKNEIKKDEVNTYILRRISDSVVKSNKFNVMVNPGTDIPEQRKPALVVLSPEHYANPQNINGHTEPLIKQIALKKGNSSRQFRNTLLFLLCSEIGITRLQQQVSELLACQKIRDEYKSQLEQEQKDDLRKKIEAYVENVNKALVEAYTIVVKYTAAQGLEKLVLKQFASHLHVQIDGNLYELLRTEEWMLEAVGLGLLRRNNLLPTVDKPIQVKTIHEAFLRFDDKPMINHRNAVRNSLLKYYRNGEYAIGTKDVDQGEVPNEYTKVFFEEEVPGFDLDDESYWLVDKSVYQSPPSVVADLNQNGDYGKETPRTATSDQTVIEAQPAGGNSDQETPQVKTFQSVTISGQVSLENYTQIFNSFVRPLVNNNIEIEIRIKGNTTSTHPLTENSDQYKITKESARQLGLNFEEE